MQTRKRIFIGIPCYSSVAHETYEDGLRFTYHLGRRMPDIDFFLGVKPKSEQFRARNSLVEASLSVGADYLFMIDDDHIIEFQGTSGDSQKGEPKYDIIKRLLAHDVDIVGPLYYQRGGTAFPVVMQEREDGEPFFLNDAEITGKLMEVAVQGGGCMLIKMHVFDKIASPWFQPEFTYGTDVQICKKARDAGFKVYCDTSIELGHVMEQRTIVTSENKDRFRDDQIQTNTNKVLSGWQTDSILHKYKYDAAEYLCINENYIDVELQKLWDNYPMQSLSLEGQWGVGTPEYYAHMGDEQLARQVLFHHNDFQGTMMAFLMKSLTTSKPKIAIDFGCGSAPNGFELARRGHIMHFHDIDGACAYEFLKWRCKKYDLDQVKFNEWPEPKTAEYALFLDVIEHLSGWEEILLKTIECLKMGGYLFQNFVTQPKSSNPEHVFTDKGALMGFMVEHGMYPYTSYIFMKRDDEKFVEEYFTKESE